MTADAEPLERLAHYVERRIAELGLEYAAVCRAGGFSDETLLKIRKGTRVRSTTYRKLEIALHWAPASVEATLSGGEPIPDEAAAAEEPEEPQPSEPGELSPGEALRRVIRSSARELGVTRDGLEEVLQLVLQDLEDLSPSTADTVSVRTDLSELVRERRLAVGLSLEDVAMRAVGPGSGERLVEADWLDRLERAALIPAEYPEYPQLDALVDALNLDPARVQEAAGAQFLDVQTVWSDDGEVRAIVQGELSAKDLAKVQDLMNLYRRAPKLDG